MKPESRICCRCGGGFIAHDKRQRYCGRTCSLKAGDERRPTLGTRACAHCGKDFKRRRASQIFCSLECKRRAQGVKPRGPKAKASCRQCGNEFTPLRHDAKFCSVECAQQSEYAVRRGKNAAKLKTIACVGCGQEFQQRRKDTRYCSPECYARHYHSPAFAKLNSLSRPAAPAAKAARPADLPAPAASTKATDEAARLLADGFFLGHLSEEVARIGKLPGIVESLEAALVDAIADDAVWPTGRPGRIALTLALLNNPALARHRWRHPHEQRRRPGDPRKPTGTALRARGIVGLRS